MRRTQKGTNSEKLTRDNPWKKKEKEISVASSNGIFLLFRFIATSKRRPNPPQMRNNNFIGIPIKKVLYVD